MDGEGTGARDGGGVGVARLDNVDVQIPGGQLGLVYRGPDPVAPLTVHAYLVEGLAVRQVQGVEVKVDEEGGVKGGGSGDVVE